MIRMKIIPINTSSEKNVESECNKILEENKHLDIVNVQFDKSLSISSFGSSVSSDIYGRKLILFYKEND